MGPSEDKRAEGQNTLHDKTYILEGDKGDKPPEDTLKPSPQAVDLEPGNEPLAFEQHQRENAMDKKIEISGPPDYPPFGQS